MLVMPKRGLYAITPEAKSSDEILMFTQAVLSGGARIIQYRVKSCSVLEKAEAHVTARQLLILCHAYNVPLIINDDIALAEKIGADGVHLGKEDGSILQARQQLGEKAIVGLSCYNSMERAIKGEQQGVDYVALGRFFVSQSKPFAEAADIGTLTATKKVVALPIVAIGGILPENGATLIEAGASFLAVIGGLATQSPKIAAQNYCQLFDLTSD